MHINRVTLLGDIADAPKLIETKGGAKLLKVNLCTEKHVTKKDGSDATIRNFHRVTIWGNRATDLDSAGLTEGDPLYVEGEVQYGSYEKDGEKKYTTDINVGFDGTAIVFPAGAVETQADENPFN